MGRRRPGNRNAHSSVDPSTLLSGTLSISPALRSVGTYVTRVRSDTDHLSASLSVLREIALDLSTSGIVVSAVYHRLLKEGLCTVQQLKDRDPFLVKFLDRNLKMNCFRELRLQYQVVDLWNMDWEVELAFPKVSLVFLLIHCCLAQNPSLGTLPRHP
jgi:hypothetical protein